MPVVRHSMALGLGALLLLAWPPQQGRAQPASCPSAPSSGAYSAPPYNFRFASVRRASSILYCVANRHPTRGLFVDWREAGFSGWVPANSPVVFSLPVTRAERVITPFYFGAGLRRLNVQTEVFSPRSGVATAEAAPSVSGGRVWLVSSHRRNPPGFGSGSGASLFIPRLASLRNQQLRGSALRSFYEENSEVLQRLSFSFFQSGIFNGGSAQLSFRLSFETEGLGAPGEPVLFARIQDPDVHRLIFDSEQPQRLTGPQAAKFEGVSTVDASRLVRVRTVVEVLLEDRETVLARLPISSGVSRQ